MSIHQSFWSGTTETPALPDLNINLKTDTLIIGGGITGVTAAWLLHKAGKEVVLIEGETVGAGVTSHTSGHLTAVFDSHFSTLADAYNLEIARKIYNTLSGSIDFIEKTIAEENLAADFQRINGYWYAENKAQRKQLEKEFEIIEQMDVGATLIKELPVPFSTQQGVLFPNQARFHVTNYLFGLVKKLTDAGVQLYQKTKAVQVQEKEAGTGVLVSLENGQTIEAERVIMATHSPLGINPVQTTVAPYRSYVVAVKVKNLPEDGLFWDMQDPYRYTRRASYHGEPILIVGGFDHKTGQHAHTKKVYIELQDYVRSRFGLEELLFSWSGQVFEPADHLPFIGKSPFQKNIYIATGYSGDGLTWGTAAAHIITDIITSSVNEMIEIVNPGRLHFAASAKEFIKENTNVAYRFVKDRFAITKADIKSIKPGEGKLIKYDKEHLAVYCDEQGLFHAMSPVCPHLKCIVQWNKAEKTWDCPCHGGRFNCTGEVLEGPPMHDLNKVEIYVA